MAVTVKPSVVPLNPGEAKALKARIYDLSEVAAKQALYGLVQVLSCKPNIRRSFFEVCVDDAAKYTRVKKEP